jgi:hypothetical protein
MDDEYNYGADATPSPVAVDTKYYSADDDWQNNNNYYSAKGTTSWLDRLFSNSTQNLELNPAQDVNPDNVLASLVFNSLVCVILLVVYELLRKFIPSVYAQAIASPDKVVYLSMASDNSSNKMSDGIVAVENDNVPGSVTGVHDGCDASCDDIRSNVASIPFPILEWCIPVHKTPWSTFRQLAGLDAYFFLRYIRMCLKITAVSSFWASFCVRYTPRAEDINLDFTISAWPMSCQRMPSGCGSPPSFAGRSPCIAGSVFARK